MPRQAKPYWQTFVAHHQQSLVIAGIVVVAGLLALFTNSFISGKARAVAVAQETPKRVGNVFYPTTAQWTNLGVEQVATESFRSEHVTEGKISIDEDQSTLIFSPYSGRVLRLFARSGQTVERGQPLFVVEATDTVQTQNDFITAVSARNKAHSQLNLVQVTERRHRELFEKKSISTREYENTQALLTAAQNDARSSDTGLEAARNRLKILGLSDEEIEALQNKGAISPETVIRAPISGTIVQRKVGPGQYVTNSVSDPVFVIGDLSRVWLIAYVRESAAPLVRVGQTLRFTVLAFPQKAFEAEIDYVSSTLEATTRRLYVRATIENPDKILKPEMFASVALLTGEDNIYPSLPREAVIYDGDVARIWVARADKGIEARSVKIGPGKGKRLAIVEGLNEGERVIVKGSIFLDRQTGG